MSQRPTNWPRELKDTWPSTTFVLRRGSTICCADVKSILLAEEVIAINQDPLGVAGDLIWKQGPNEVWRALLFTCLDLSGCSMCCPLFCMTCSGPIAHWGSSQMARDCCASTTAADQAAMVHMRGMQVYAAPLQGGGRAVVLFNRHHPEYKFNDVTVTWPMLGYVGCEDAVVRDLYKRSNLGTHAGEQQPRYSVPDRRIGAGCEAQRPARSACTFAALCMACVTFSFFVHGVQAASQQRLRRTALWC
jgi:Alpha galactosidase C-terminal beta sandwich domain